MEKFKKLILNLTVIILLSAVFSSYVFATDTVDVNSRDVSTNAPSCILIDVKTGRILYSKNAYKRMYPASTTKLMTAILTLENCNLSDKAVVSHDAIFSIPVGYSHANLKEGEELTIEQLLNVLLIPSANDAAVVLAEHIAGSVENFSAMMNNKAKELGCLNTNFVNPNGIHDNSHYSTAYDLSLIGKYAMQFSDIMRIAKCRRYTLPTTNKYNKTDRMFNATNALINDESMNKNYYPYATGLKTGYTDKSGSCIVATAKKDEQELLAVILKSSSIDTRYVDCKTLFNYGFENYTYTTLNKKNDVIKQVSISNGTKETKDLNIITQSDIKVLTKKGNSTENVQPQIEINSDLKAPIAENTVVGKITYTIDDISYSSDLIADHTVYPSSLEVLLFRGLLIFLILLIIYKVLKSTKKSSNRKYIKSSKNKSKGPSKRHKNSKNSSHVVELDSDFYYNFSKSSRKKKRKRR